MRRDAHKARPTGLIQDANVVADGGTMMDKDESYVRGGPPPAVEARP